MPTPSALFNLCYNLLMPLFRPRGEYGHELEPPVRTLQVECGDGRTRIVTVNVDTNLVIRSIVTASPVERGWRSERPPGPVSPNIPIRGTDEHWNADDDPLPEFAV